MIERIPKHMIVAMSSWIARGVSAIIQILSIRYFIEILGQEKYAIMILLTGLIAFCNLIDLGIGNSVLSVISERRANNKKYGKIIVYSSISSFLILIISLIPLYFLSEIFAPFYFQNFSDLLIRDKVILFYVVLLTLCLTAISGLIYKIWYAEQVGWLSNIYPALGSILGLIFLIYISKLDFSNLTEVLDVFVVFYLPLALMTTILLLRKIINNFDFNFSFKEYLKVTKIIILRAAPFLLFALMGVVVLQTDYLVLSQKITVEHIILYGVLMKIFNVIYFVYSAVLQAWWPVCTELRIRKKWKKLRKSIIYSIILGAFLIIVLGLSVYYFQRTIWLLLNIENIEKAPFIIFILFILYFVVRVWCDTFAVLLQTMNYMRPLFIIIPVQLVINLFLQWNLAERYGLIGILLGLILSFLLTVTIYLPWKYLGQIKLEMNK